MRELMEEVYAEYVKEQERRRVRLIAIDKEEERLQENIEKEISRHTGINKDVIHAILKGNRERLKELWEEKMLLQK